MRIGIDLGGTKIEGVGLGEDGALRCRHRVKTPAGSYADTVQEVVALVSMIQESLGERASVGIGIPGIISARTGLVKNANSTALIGHPLDRDVAAALGRPVRVENDANCFVISEAVDGAASDVAVAFGVILGSGVGGGITIEKRLIHGRNQIAGEWGHNPLPWPRSDELPGPQCYCGKTGCIETFLSGPALSAQFQQRTGEQLDAKEIALAADQGHPEAVALLEIYADRLARGLAHIINILDPDKIVLGGGLSNMKLLYRSVPPLLQRYVFSDSVDTPIVRAFHGDSSGVRGAAWLWPQVQDLNGPRN